jgi:hypothetical protein
VCLRTMAGVGMEVFVRRGQLARRFLTPIAVLYRGFPLHPVDDTDPNVFRIDLSDFGLPLHSRLRRNPNANNGGPLRCDAAVGPTPVAENNSRLRVEGHSPSRPWRSSAAGPQDTRSLPDLRAAMPRRQLDLRKVLADCTT